MGSNCARARQPTHYISLHGVLVEQLLSCWCRIITYLSRVEVPVIADLKLKRKTFESSISLTSNQSYEHLKRQHSASGIPNWRSKLDILQCWHKHTLLHTQISTGSYYYCVPTANICKYSMKQKMSLI